MRGAQVRRQGLVHRYLEAAAIAAPSRPAVVDGERSITYRDLDEASTRVAASLRGAGADPGDLVGLWVPKSIEAVIGLYGILKAGCAYVPLDPSAPTARLGVIAADAGVRVLVSSLDRATGWSELRAAGASLDAIVSLTGERSAHPDLDGIRLVALGDPATTVSDVPAPVTDPDHLAYVLYTSGSTGVPKGVMLSHHNACAFVDWAVTCFGLGSEDRVSSHAPFHFDLSVFDLFASAAAAATVVLVPAGAAMFPVESVRFLEREQITVWYSVPSALTAMVLRGGIGDAALGRLRTVLFAGEVFPTRHLRTLMHHLPHVSFANLYGPTETNVCTWYPVPGPPEGDDPIPIGRPIDGDAVFVVDDDGAVVGDGAVGELYVSGATVMAGYWGDVERTAATLVPNEHADNGYDVAYRTGDLVRWRADGTLEFLGRRDAQVKTRGHRVELGEIETMLHAHPAVVACAVVAVPDESVSNRLHAFVEADGVDGPTLGRHLRARLPRYMVPESIDVVARMPTTTTGKIDRQALAKLIEGF